MRLLDLFVLGAAIAAGQPNAPPGPAPFRSGTRIVEVILSATKPPNAFALRDLIHRPVNDLRAPDLRVFDNGVPQTIASFEKITSSLPVRDGVSVAGNNSAPRPASTIILFDGLNTLFPDQFVSHDAIAKLLDRLPPDKSIAILAMDDSFRVLQDFSTDRAALRAAIYKYERDYPFAAYGRGPLPFPDMDLLTRTAKTVDAFKQVARLASNVRGRKNVVWVSSGFAFARFYAEAIKGVRELVAANVAIYPVSPAGLAQVNADSIVELAALTGGKAFYGSNDVTAMAQSAIDASAEGYVLSFVPNAYQEDGSFHQLRVETSRKRVELHYRMGYVADPMK